MPTPAEAWHEGSNLVAAHNRQPHLIRGWLVAEVGALCKSLDLKHTISNDEELLFCCRSILTEHPTLKLEEIRTCFNMMRQGKFGKFYERLKVAEILDCLRRYEGEIRVDIMERAQHQKSVEHKQGMAQRLGEMKIDEVLKDIEVKEHEPVKGHGIGSRLRRRLDNG